MIEIPDQYKSRVDMDRINGLVHRLKYLLASYGAKLVGIKLDKYNYSEDMCYFTVTFILSCYRIDSIDELKLYFRDFKVVQQTDEFLECTGIAVAPMCMKPDYFKRYLKNIDD